MESTRFDVQNHMGQKVEMKNFCNSGITYQPTVDKELVVIRRVRILTLIYTYNSKNTSIVIAR